MVIFIYRIQNGVIGESICCPKGLELVCVGKILHFGKSSFGQLDF